MPGARFAFRGRNTPRVRPTPPLCAGSLGAIRPLVSWARRQHALTPLPRSTCLGVRCSRFVLSWRQVHAHANVPAPLHVPRCEGRVSRAADGASKPPSRPTQALLRALCALRTARGRVRIAPPRRVAGASCLAASTRALPPPASGAVRALRAARAHRRSEHVSAARMMHVHWRTYDVSAAPPPCSARSGERPAGGTRQCPPHPAAACGDD